MTTRPIVSIFALVVLFFPLFFPLTSGAAPAQKQKRLSRLPLPANEALFVPELYRCSVQIKDESKEIELSPARRVHELAFSGSQSVYFVAPPTSETISFAILKNDENQQEDGTENIQMAPKTFKWGMKDFQYASEQDQLRVHCVADGLLLDSSSSVASAQTGSTTATAAD